ncbi:hypothetical protein MTO96_028387 [Rhipicephalus appendiculatus]
MATLLFLLAVCLSTAVLLADYCHGFGLGMINPYVINGPYGGYGPYGDYDMIGNYGANVVGAYGPYEYY